MEMDCGDILEQAAVSDWSPSGLDLPQISEDSVVRGAAVAPSIDYEVSSFDIISISVGHRHGTGYVRKLDQGPRLTVDRFYIRYGSVRDGEAEGFSALSSKSSGFGEEHVELAVLILPDRRRLQFLGIL
ncbi:hypothetical protein F2Q69_00013173 [Brassica cretica]|uniref:Uncharacterized protein n=1 Tax=Brassica cretica TaxID=69181 RepID=A0A8S9R4R9_BRACR|nr:hypothetical protein F2Q69_00013173 [Brassica cretica]